MPKHRYQVFLFFEGEYLSGYFEIGGWGLQKAGEASGNTVPIRLIANKLSLDKQNEEILPQAFNKATVQRFLEHGIIDWHHKSVFGKNSLEKAQAILGHPTNFQWEKGLPVVYADLTRNHPIVQTAILPHLEADQPVFAASVGGSIIKAQVVHDPRTRQAVKRQVLEIDWNHLAIAAAPYVISPGSMVSMVKAETGEEFARYSDLGAFCKAFEMGAGTDIAAYTGAGAIRGQSLEGGMPVVLNDDGLIEEIVMAISSGEIVPTREGVADFLLVRKGLTRAETEVFLSRLARAINSIL